MLDVSPKDIQRFMNKVKKTDNCWEWTAYITNNGYGSFYLNKKSYLSHRISYELFIGLIPKELQLDHLCRNRKCVNPEHLEPVTQKENILRGVGITAINKNKTHCPKGHEYTERNTKIRHNKRSCRKCKVIAQTIRRKKFKCLML